jgi:hypothetical protein
MRKLYLLTFMLLGTTLMLAQNPVFDPAYLSASLPQNDSVVLYTIMHNYSSDTMEFNFPLYSARGQGGPDAFGYTWSDSDDPNGPDWAWTEISETGTEVEGLFDDNVIGPFDIGFDFPFYGENRSQFYVQSNGAISFNDAVLSFANSPIPTNNSNNHNFIAWFWDDLIIDSGWTHVYYKSNEEQLVVQFSKLTHFPGSEEWITAEVVLRPNGIILLRYQQIRENFPVDGGTVGIQSGNPEMGLQVVYNAPYLHSELAIRFQLTRNFITSVVPASGHLPPNSQEHIWITYNSTGYEPGSYEQDLECQLSLPEVPVAYVHNTMTVTAQPSCGFKGYVTRSSNGEPLNDVLVVVGDHQTYTGSNGYYELPLEQGVYNVHFTREGYQPKVVEDTTALPGMSQLDVQLDHIDLYAIAGRVFAGDPAIESGFAYGYKMNEGIVVDIYAEMVGVEGHYEFSGLSPAQYIIKAEPSPNSQYYGDFLPTYYGDVLHWEEATVINLTGTTDGRHIHLIPVTASPQGPGSISGIISNENGRSGAANIPIVLRSSDPASAIMTYSSTDGSFLFSGISLGTYQLFAEIPGKAMTPESITLDETNQSATGIDMLIQTNQIVVVGAGIADVLQSAPVIYPNPVKDKLNIVLDPAKPVLASITLMDMTGRIVLQVNRNITGPETIVTDVSGLSNGVYNLRIEAEGISVLNKVIK